MEQTNISGRITSAPRSKRYPHILSGHSTIRNNLWSGSRASATFYFSYPSQFLCQIPCQPDDKRRTLLHSVSGIVAVYARRISRVREPTALPLRCLTEMGPLGGDR